jgi:biopolymer transport protein ExbD
MKEMSRRAKRMDRNHKAHKPPVLNLVSLMDIFTILVFFLLVSSSNTQQLPSPRDLSLPTSIAKKVPKETLVITITQTQIIVQGRKVADIQEELAKNQPLIPALNDELLFHSQMSVFASEEDKKKGRPVTIMGDENIPYEMLRKILATCRQANYTLIAFGAVQQVKDKS